LARDARLAIHPAYHAAVRRLRSHIAHEAGLEPGAGQQLVTATRDGVLLHALVSPATRIVRRAAFQGAGSAVQRVLMECLCAIMEGKPLQECADHATIFVERCLRDPNAIPPVPGVVTPENADPAFALPQSLVRELLGQCHPPTGDRSTENFYDRPVGASWAAFSTHQRSEAVERVLRNQNMSSHVAVLGIDGLKRVIVSFTTESSSGERQTLLARLEAELHRTVEPTLQVVAQAKADTNVLRIIEKRQAS